MRSVRRRIALLLPAIVPVVVFRVGPARGAELSIHGVPECPGWEVQSSPSPGSVLSNLLDVEAISSSDVWAVGTYLNADRIQQPLALHDDGTAWTQVTVPSVAGGGTPLYGVSAVSGQDAWAVGFASKTFGTVAEHWDGTQWAIVATPNVGLGLKHPLRGLRRGH